MSEETQNKIKKSLRYSIFDGTFYAGMVGTGESFFSAFAVYLKATSLQLGILSALPMSLGSIIQLYSIPITRLLKSRRLAVIIGVFIQILTFVPIILCTVFGVNKVNVLIASVCVYYIMGMIVAPPWNSWMGDLVDENERGKYFGRREKFVGLVTFVCYISSGYFLQLFSSFKMDYMGFALLFVLAMISRSASLRFLFKQYEPQEVIAEETRVGFVKFIRTASENNFGRYVMYLCMMTFAVSMSGPYFTPYMLNELSLKYGIYTIIFGMMMIVKFLMAPVWGYLCDRYGSRRVLAVAGYTMPIVPILYIFSSNVTYLIAINIISGFTWAGYAISSFNFILDTTTKENRLRFVSYYNVLNGIAMLIGAATGAMVVKYIHVMEYKYFGVFIMSGLMRFLSSLIFIPKLKEIRTVEDISTAGLFVTAIRTAPVISTLYDLVSMKRRWF